MTPPPSPDAASILIDAADTLTERGKQRDKPSGERSMARTVAAFNAIYGSTLTEQQGWQFMVLLKIARSSAGGYRADDYVDQAGYAALAGECAAAAATPAQNETVHVFDSPAFDQQVADALAFFAASELAQKITTTATKFSGFQYR